MALKLKGSTSGFVGLDAPSVSGNNTLILPENSGSAQQLLGNDITAGVVTFTSVTVNRNGDLTVPGTISIGGTLTYEDVTSVDSIGIVTARGLSIFGNTTGLNATGVSTFTDDVTFTGAAANLTWDKSTNVLGFADNANAYFGTGNDLRVYHTGSHSYIENTNGDLIINGDTILLKDGGNNETLLTATKDGTVDLYYDNSKRFNTTPSGVDVTGTLNVSGISTFTGNVFMPDNAEIRLGASGDLQLFHHSSTGEGRIYNSNAAGINIITDLINIKNNANNETMFKATNGGSVELYYNNLRKFRTVSDGVEVNASEGADAVLALIADEGDDNADYWRFLGGTAGQLDIANYATGNWINHMTINGSGHVTKPRTAMFSARGQDNNWHYFNSGSGWYNLGDASYSGSAYYIDHGWTTSGTGCGVRGVLANGNSVWENDKARFTAPVNGFYMFEISMYIRTFNGGSTFHLQPWIDSSDTSYYTSNIGSIRDSSNNVTGDTAEYPHVHRSITVYLSANQIFRWAVYAQGTDRFQTYKGYAHQSGFLVG